MLERLDLRSVGPANEMSVQFGSRLNVITGDNGLGKSFLLDVAWWVLTQTWAAGRALPNKGAERDARIGYEIIGADGYLFEDESRFDVHREGWYREPGRPSIPGLVVSVRVDGSFAVMDPKRNERPEWGEDGSSMYPRRPPAFLFGPEAVWSGLTDERGVSYCNGIIADWRVWQLEGSDEFAALSATLDALSPDRDERLVPGPPRRLDLLDSRDIPTLRMPYGDVPITHASAGIRRILALAYLLVWAWHEHRAAAELLGEPPLERVTLLIDEVEAHLHPRWQRVILPALLQAVERLGGPVHTQIVCVTHSPLVLASLEAHWHAERDRLLTLDLERGEGDVMEAKLHEVAWRTRGDVNAWLTSEIFDLGQARSLEAEDVINRARDVLQRPGESVAALGDLAGDLARVLPETDPLLARIDALAADQSRER